MSCVVLGARQVAGDHVRIERRACETSASTWPVSTSTTAAAADAVRRARSRRSAAASRSIVSTRSRRAPARHAAARRSAPRVGSSGESLLRRALGVDRARARCRSCRAGSSPTRARGRSARRVARVVALRRDARSAPRRSSASCSRRGARRACPAGSSDAARGGHLDAGQLARLPARRAPARSRLTSSRAPGPGGSARARACWRPRARWSSCVASSSRPSMRIELGMPVVA